MRTSVFSAGEVPPSEVYGPDVSHCCVHPTRPRGSQPTGGWGHAARQARSSSERREDTRILSIVRKQSLGSHPRRSGDWLSCLSYWVVRQSAGAHERPRFPPTSQGRKRRALGAETPPRPARPAVFAPPSLRRGRPLFLPRHSPGRRRCSQVAQRDAPGRQRARVRALRGARHVPPPPWELRSAEVTSCTGLNRFPGDPRACCCSAAAAEGGAAARGG